MNHQSYIYFVNLEDFLVSHNFAVTNTISSPSITHISTHNTEHPIYSVTLDKLLMDLDLIKGFINPRISKVLLSCMHNNGLKIGIGVENTKFYTDQEVEKINDLANLEIEFERIRRQIAPKAPSRLICLYLAEDSHDGRTMLKNMFYYRTDFKIVEVEILCNLKFHKADTKWIDDYLASKSLKAIENYWKGIHYDSRPQYEYLLDGQIALRRSEDKNEIYKDYIGRFKKEINGC